MNLPDARESRLRLPLAFGVILSLGLLVYCVFVCDRTVADPAGPFSFDPSQPFKLDFGRGSGMDGLETVAIEEDGQTSLYRSRIHGKWEHAILPLSSEQVRAVAQAMTRHGLPRLQKAYLNKNIADGTQWVLWIRQGQREKATYFDNSFPSSIRAFASDLDRLLKSAGYDALIWYPSNGRGDKPLWNSIR